MLRRTVIPFTRGYQTRTGVFGHAPRRTKEYSLPESVLKARAQHSNFYRLVTAYREQGHKYALINPVSLEHEQPPAVELDPRMYNLTDNETTQYRHIAWLGKEQGTVREAVDALRATYCGHVTIDMSGLALEEREWLSERLEGGQGKITASDKETKVALATQLLKSQAMDQFLAAKFSTLKRYGGEGAESMMAFFWQLLHTSQTTGVTDLVLAMTHRGRLNVLTSLFKLPPALIFRKIRGLSEFPECAEATGDVLSHLTSSVDVGSVHVTVLPNPSHLEASNPVSMGKTRAKQLGAREDNYGDGNSTWGSQIVNVQVHGDAGFIGQGINQETLSLSQVPHFQVGGSVHLIVNNQVGFTTPGERGRSSRYTSDLAKMIQSPVFHVNGDHPEEVAWVTRLALEYQRNFRRDVFVELSCYRRWGHNEIDDPTFTNPALYRLVNARQQTVPDSYADQLISEGVLTREEVDGVKKGHHAMLNRELKREDYKPQRSYFEGNWKGIVQSSRHITTWDTGLETQLLRFIGTRSVAIKSGFNVHPHLAKSYVNARLARLHEPCPVVDWATAEAMAIGSLLYQGFNVRLSGQDVGRGTFSQRHAMLVDQETNDIYIPLNHMIPEQTGKLEVANSTLSEEAVLGYEYGFSLESPNNLVIWEAQFGDFNNGAQIIIDTSLASGETKWMKCSGIVILLPHGYDGAGPEHSSCRLERFLQLTDSSEIVADGDNINMQVAAPSTPAQYYHLLRQQQLRNYRKPLVVVGPKTLLRLPEATSPLHDMGPDTHFHQVLQDPHVTPSSVTKVVFVSGKHFYSLDKERKAKGIQDTALVRLESLVPFPVAELQNITRAYPKASKFVWSQEEPRNSGAWSFIKPRFDNLVGLPLRYAGLPQLPSPSYGTARAHLASQHNTIQDTFG